MSNTNKQVVENTVLNGLVRGIALDVLRIVEAKPDMTAGEIYKRYVKMNPGTTRSRNEIAKRVSDLKNWGAIKISGTKNCSLTGRKTSTWKMTGKMPERMSNEVNEKTDTVMNGFVINLPKGVSVNEATLQSIRADGPLLSEVSDNEIETLSPDSDLKKNRSALADRAVYFSLGVLFGTVMQVVLNALL